MLALRVLLSRENKRRDATAKSDETSEETYIEETLDDGTKVEKRVDKVSKFGCESVLPVGWFAHC